MGYVYNHQGEWRLVVCHVNDNSSLFKPIKDCSWLELFEFLPELQEPGWEGNVRTPWELRSLLIDKMDEYVGRYRLRRPDSNTVTGVDGAKFWYDPHWFVFRLQEITSSLPFRPSDCSNEQIAAYYHLIKHRCFYFERNGVKIPAAETIPGHMVIREFNARQDRRTIT